MPIRELFHFMHLVGDFDPVHERYAELLAPRDWGPKSWGDFDKRWATLANVGTRLRARDHGAEQGARRSRRRRCPSFTLATVTTCTRSPGTSTAPTCAA